MKTLVTESVAKAAGFIKRGEIVAFPTETVYGLGANVYNGEAVKKIYNAKGRAFDNPLIVHVASKVDIYDLAAEVPKLARDIINEMFPGPITVILRKNEIISGLVTAGLDTIAVRMPASKIARDLINQAGVPIAAPSANLSGSPSPTTFKHVLEDFEGVIPCVLKGPDAKHGLESTVIDCTTSLPHILRPGVVTVEDLRSFSKMVEYVQNPGKVKSPGIKYRHYSPKAKVKIFDSGKHPEVSDPDRTAYIGLTHFTKLKGFSKLKSKLVCKSPAEYGKKLFSFFRRCDMDGIKIIYCESVEEQGIGLAIMNRLGRATKTGS